MRWLVIIFASLVGLAACKSKTVASGPKPPAGIAEVRGPSVAAKPAFYEHIPADSPMVMASFEPISKGFATRLAGIFGPATELFLSKMTSVADPELQAELRQRLTWKGLEEIGLDLTPTYAFYMVESSLVGRVSLADGQKLRSYIHELGQRFGVTLATEMRAGVELRRLEEGNVTVVVGVGARELVFGVFPSARASTVLPVLLGETRPARNIVDAGVLEALRRQYRFDGAGVGYVDVLALFDLMHRSDSGLAGTDFDLSGMSTVCYEEARKLLSIMPRIVVGYEELSGQRMSFVYVAELTKEWVDDLQRVLLPVPGLVALEELQPTFALGLGVDVEKAFEVLPARMIATVGPLRCPDLAKLNDMGSELKGASTMLPTRSIRGGLFVADRMDFSAQDLSGSVLLASSAPASLLSMLGMVVPNMPTVPSTGEVIEVPAPSSIPVPGPLYVALTDQLVGVGIGAAQDQFLAEAMAERAEPDGPFFLMDYNYGKLAEIVPVDGEDISDEGKMTKGLLEMFGMVRMRLFATDSGLLMRYVLDL